MTTGTCTFMPNGICACTEHCGDEGCQAGTDVIYRAGFLAGIKHAEPEIARLNALLNTPELIDFSAAVTREAAHQRKRWGTEHDIGKAPEDWFWLVGYLAGKCLASHKEGARLEAEREAEEHTCAQADLDCRADDAMGKALHHTISTAAALANWHAAILGASNAMQPGHAPSIELASKEASGETGVDPGVQTR